MQIKFISVFVCVIFLLGTLSAYFPVYAQEKERLICSVLIEAESKVIISSKNEAVQVPVGVMSKLMTVYLVAEHIQNGQLSIDDKLKASSDATTVKGATIWLIQGEEITVDQLLKAVIIGNANDASVVLAEAVSGTEEKFAKKMNETAYALGMKNSVFTNCHGFIDDDKQLSTAYDLAILCSALAEYDFLTEYFISWRDFVRDGQTELVNMNELVKTYKDIIGFKTGYTKAAGYCTAAAAERNGVTYISVALGYEEKTDSLSKAKSLLNTAFAEYMVFIPEAPTNIPVEIPVKGGTNKTVPIEYGKIRKIVLPTGAINSVSSKIIITDYVYAPVPVGYKVGELQFLRNDKLMFCVDIVTKEKIEEINAPKALNIILKKLLTF